MTGVDKGSAWKQLPLEEVATLQRGYDLPIQARRAGEVPIFAANGPVGTHAERKCLGPGVITGRSGTIGKVHYVEGDYWPLNTSLYVKDFHGNQPRYIYWLLSQLRLDRYYEGSGVPTLNRNVVHRIPVPVPPLAQQRRIAEVLDRADVLRTRRIQLLALIDTLPQSILQETVGDPIANPRGWRAAKLGDITTKIGSGSTPTGGDAAYKASGISLIRSLNVRDGEFSYRDLAYIDDGQARRLSGVVVQQEDVLLNITGASVARVCRAPRAVLPARVNQHVTIIRSQGILLPRYLEQVLRAPSVKAKLLQIAESGATRQAITKAQIEALSVPVPPLHVQQELDIRLHAVEQLRHRMRLALQATARLFSSLQERAFAREL